MDFSSYGPIFGHTSSRPPEKVCNEKELISKYIRNLNNRISHYYRLARERCEVQKQKAKTLFDKRTSYSIPSGRKGFYERILN